MRTLYDEQGRWLGDYRADGSPVQQAVWLDDLPVALLTTTAAGLPSLAYIEPDHLGTPRVVIDSDRDVALWRWPLEKDAFGAHAPEDDVDGDGISFELNLRHPGQQYTAASGLYYNYYRDLDASIGRYVQSDPIGLAGGISTYGYVAGRPLFEIDPKGLRGRLAGRPLNNPGFKPAPPALTPDGYPAPMPARATVNVSPPRLADVVAPLGMTLFPLAPVAASYVYHSRPPENAYDADGPKAPGMPGEPEGFCHPKAGPTSGAAPNGRGYGWVDKDGSVWVPTGNNGGAHGGPHWDVQSKGGYENVYPGGRRR